MKDTIFKGKKNNMYYQTILNKNGINRKSCLRLSSSRVPSFSKPSPRASEKDSPLQLFYSYSLSNPPKGRNKKRVLKEALSEGCLGRELCGRSYQLYIKNYLFFPYRLGLNQKNLSACEASVFGKGEGRKYYHISNIRAVNRIGPHNEEILSVIIGSLLGDAYANKRSGEGVRLCYRQSILHKEYLF